MDTWDTSPVARPFWNFFATPEQRTRLAVFSMFAIDGMGFGTWAAFLPTYKASLHLSDGELGIPLFAMVVGSLISMPTAGRVLATRGSRVVMIASALAFCGVLPLIALAAVSSSGLIGFTLAALAFGAAKGALDVSSNAQAIGVEHSGGQPIVSACHGFWSLGVLCGAVLVALALAVRIPPLLATSLVATLLFGIVVTASRSLREEDPADSPSEGQVPSSIWPRGRLIPLAALAFLALFCEGAMSDWAGIYLAGDVGATASAAALGYASYSLLMTVGRFAGDWLVARFGPAALLSTSGLSVALGLSFALALRSYPSALVGFAFIGFGLANMVPVLFRTAAGGDHGSGGAIAAVSTVGYLGFLTGPPIIGALSRVVGLSHALVIVVAFGLIIAGFARSAIERRGRNATSRIQNTILAPE